MCNWWLFRDYLSWLRETLEYVKDCGNANWIVKAHPHAEAYNCHQKDYDEIKRITHSLDNHNIRLLPADTNLKSLIGFADVILTVRGTVGLEFACFGIPCIVTAESAYSGFGFSLEPGTKGAYFQLLSKVSEIDKLNADQVRMAKVVAFIEFVLMGAETGFLSHKMPHIGNFDTNKLWWGELCRNIKSTTPMTDPFFDRLEKFLSADTEHLLKRNDLYEVKE